MRTDLAALREEQRSLAARAIRHDALGEAWSHSHVVEWIFGSFIQSHWPWRTLWPISMLSRILATASEAMPAIHAGGNSEKISAPRPPTSRARCTAMTLWM